MVPLATNIRCLCMFEVLHSLLPFAREESPRHDAGISATISSTHVAVTKHGRKESKPAQIEGCETVIRKNDSRVEEQATPDWERIETQRPE